MQYSITCRAPEDQLLRLFAAHTLLQAGIHHVVWAEHAMGIGHSVPIGWGSCDLELLTSSYDIVKAAHLICLKHPYIPTDIREAHYWPGNPKDYKPLTTVLLRHRDYPNCYHRKCEPPHIYLHTGSAFHFDIQDPTITIAHPCPPDISFKGLLFPSLIPFCNAIIDSIHEPPLPYYHQNFYVRWLRLLSELCRHTAGEKGWTVKRKKLVGRCEWLLQGIKEENRPFLSRLLLDLRYLRLQTSAFERILIKEARCKREGFPFQCPIVLPASHISDTYVPPKRKLLQDIRKATALNPTATLWRFSPSSFRPLLRLATRR